MLESQLSEAIVTARTIATLDNAARLMWRGHSEGLISDSGAEALSAAAEARRDALRGKCRPLLRQATRSRPRPCRSPERNKSIARRRGLAASGAVPGTIAANFTTGEIAALTVIARQCQRSRSCDWFMDRIAAVAGVSRTTVRNALRQAQHLGLISILERRRTAWRSDSNVIRVSSAEWLLWLGMGGGRKKSTPTNTKLNILEGNGSLFTVDSRHVVATVVDFRHGKPSSECRTTLSR